MQKSTSFTVQEAQKKLEHYCAYQERCHQEVILKLKSLNMIPDAIDQIIWQLITDNYLNETRFAQSFARGKFRIKKWGKIRILNQLKFRGISAWNIKKAMAEIEPGEYFDTFGTLFDRIWNQYEHLGISNAEKKYMTAYSIGDGKMNSSTKHSTEKNKRILKNKTEFLNSRFFRAWEPD
jgi:regulatory protein